MSMTTVFYESIEDEEILFQPQGMKVQYKSKTEQINKLELHEQWMEQTKKQYAEEIIRAETSTHTEKVEDYAECVKQSKIAKEAYKYECLNTHGAWYKAFKSAGRTLLKTTNKSIKFSYGGKIRIFKICVNKNYKTGKMKERNIQFVKFLSNGAYHYMRPIYYRGEIVLNHYSEGKDECYPQKLDDVGYRCQIGFFVDDEDNEDYATTFISEQQQRRVDFLLR